MKTYEITYSNGNGIYSANLVIAESAEQATAYYTAEGREVIGCTETMSRPKPGQPVVTVPEGWTAPAAETETTETAETAETTETAETAETTETAETAPAAEPETETETVEAETAETETTPTAEAETETTPASETTETGRETERNERIADILDAVRREIIAGYYRRKQRVTARCIREAERAGVPTVRVGYCGAQWLLSYLTPAYYTAGVYGWNCDVYTVAGLTICTGYRGMVGEPAVLTADYERRASAAAGEDERNAVLAEWIAANLDAIRAAREGVRA